MNLNLRNVFLLTIGIVIASNYPTYSSTRVIIPQPIPQPNVDYKVEVVSTNKLTSDQIKRIVYIAANRTVSEAEGTWWSGRNISETYKTMFGGQLFDSYKDHPDIVISAGSFDSSAAGAQQWMPATWQGIWDKYKDKGWYPGDKFSPENQDLAFDRMITDIGAFRELEKGITVTNQIVSVSPEAIEAFSNKASSTWCSLYGVDRGGCGGITVGGTYYPAQPMRDLDFMVNTFETELKAQQKID